MMNSNPTNQATDVKPRHRILIVDDNPSIHEDFRKILENRGDPSSLEEDEELLFGASEPTAGQDLSLHIDSAYQGLDACALVEKSLREDARYTMAFVDVRMPPGLDGIETIARIWEIDPRLQIVLCSAYSDYSWPDIVAKLQRTDRLLILKKPFDVIEVHQLVCALTEKWQMARQLDAQVQTLEKLVDQRTAALENSFSLVRATLEATADGILVLDEKGGIATFNQKFLQMWQVPPVMAEAKHQDRIFICMAAQVQSADFVEKLQRLNRSSTEQAFEVLRFQDGRIFECYSQGQIVNDTIVGQVWSFRDVSKRVALEEQLRHSQKMECIGQMAGGVSHDFNNILTIIQGHAAMLQESVQPENQESVEQVLQASERASKLTRQLLAFSRRQLIRLAEIDLNQTIRAGSRMLQPLVGAHIEFQLDLGPDLPAVRADAGMVDQVMMNLTINARDAMPKGGRLGIRTSLVQIRAEEAARHSDGIAGSFIAMEVSDTGCGIAPEHMGRLFEPFFTTKDVGCGTGLGLATVYGIVKQHGGWIRVESKLGQGTTFTVYFPPSKTAAPAPQEIAPASMPHGNETILVVEDESSIRLLAGRVLKKLGYNVLEAASGRKALEMEEQFKSDIHLLLTDMVMPDGVSGMELAQRIKKTRPEMKILFSSGFSSDICGKDISLSGNFLQKPYQPQKLAASVRDCLERN